MVHLLVDSTGLGSWEVLDTEKNAPECIQILVVMSVSIALRRAQPHTPLGAPLLAPLTPALAARDAEHQQTRHEEVSVGYDSIDGYCLYQLQLPLAERSHAKPVRVIANDGSEAESNGTASLFAHCCSPLLAAIVVTSLLPQAVWYGTQSR
jgi:hypothetical protein